MDSGFKAGDSIQFHCQPGFTLVGSSTVTCLDNKDWSDHVPTCQQVTCPKLEQLDHGTVHMVIWASHDSQLDTNQVDQQQIYGYGKSLLNFLSNDIPLAYFQMTSHSPPFK